MGPRKENEGRRNELSFGTLTSIQDVLEDAKNTNFDLEQERTKFETSHLARLSRNPRDDNQRARRTSIPEKEVLHEVAQSSSTFEDYKNFTIWAVKAHSQLLRIKSVGGLTPLQLALAYGSNHGFVKTVLTHANDVGALLADSADDGRTCLHFAIESKSPYTLMMISKALETQSTTQWTQISKGLGPANQCDFFTAISGPKWNETPLHSAVVSGEDSDEKDNDSDADPGPSTSMQIVSPSQVARGVKTLSQPERRPSNAQTDKSADNSDRNSANTKATRRNGTLESRVWVKPATAEPIFNLVDVVKSLVDANPRVLVDYRDVNDETPFQARLSFLLEKNNPNLDGRSDEEKEKDHHETIENDKILKYLREYIIQNFYRRDALTALYKVGEERVLEFDLSGLPYSTINTGFLDGLGKVLKFEGLLKYVALPRLVVEDEESRGLLGSRDDDSAEPEQARKAKGKGVQHMCSIFHWLKSRKVKSVMSVTVVDDVEPSHSDEAIEACVNTLDVRTWNWYKVDLCCSVLINSAPHVRDVTLYSSGNNAVLMGWSSRDGLAMLEQLQSVHIYVEEGLERPKRLEGYMENFKKKLLALKPGLKFSWYPYKPSPNYYSVFERAGNKPTESKWMESMKTFAKFLRSAKAPSGVRPVKIAIIDDGINTALDIFNNRIHGGESFHKLSELSGRRGSYYVPSGMHGSLMAQLICEVCPNVRLYIGQLEALPGQDGRRTFTAESAAEAINWAVAQGVDIISMSWSIKSSSVLPELEEALQAAVNNRIVMFCASIDEGPTTVDKTYPGREANCIKIGACTGMGAKLSWVSETTSQFLLPGEIPQQVSEPTTHFQGSFGSSVSTALAAGLAGVLLYCDRLTSSIKKVSPLELTSARTGSLQVDPLRNKGKMAEAFGRLSRGTEYNKFPQVWDYLPQGSDTKPLMWNERSNPDQTKATQEKVEYFMRTVKSLS